MKPVDLSPFAEACGLLRPIDLRVVRADGVVLAEGELDIPCAVVGRESVCDVVLSGPAVSLRHACIQAIGGRVMVIDTGSRTGLIINGQSHALAWLTPTAPITLGGYRLSLRRPLFTRPTLPETNPLLPYTVPNDLPVVTLRFLNGKSADHEWQVNRAVTLVGRSQACKIALTADDIAPYHCYFLHTPAGLWVVDLLTITGVCVNGEAVRFALLRQDDEVSIGRFRLAVHYGLAAVALVPPPEPDPPTVEVPLTLPAPVAVPVLSDATAQLVAAQTQMLEQFQASITKVFENFGEVQREQVASLQRELTRFAELNIEMQKLQAQLMPPAHHNPLPDVDSVPAVNDESAESHNWVYERMAHLQAERRSLWVKLTSMVQGKAAL